LERGWEGFECFTVVFSDPIVLSSTLEEDFRGLGGVPMETDDADGYHSSGGFAGREGLNEGL
jgi:hypothetical protein